jgi:hypothetical protein
MPSGLNRSRGKIPHRATFMPGINPRHTLKQSFSAACLALDILSFAYGLKPVRFTPFRSDQFSAVCLGVNLRFGIRISNLSPAMQGRNMSSQEVIRHVVRRETGKSSLLLFQKRG